MHLCLWPKGKLLVDEEPVLLESVVFPTGEERRQLRREGGTMVVSYCSPHSIPVGSTSHSANSSQSNGLQYALHLYSNTTVYITQPMGDWLNNN